MSEIDPKLDEITQRIIKRSKPMRDAYLEVTKSFRPDSDVARAGPVSYTHLTLPTKA